MDAPVLFDERSRAPVRNRLRAEAARALGLDVAAARLGLEDLAFLSAAAPAGALVRVVLAELPAAELEAELRMALDPSRAPSRPRAEAAGVEGLGYRLRRGGLVLGMAPLGRWSPDFVYVRTARRAPVAYLGSAWQTARGPGEGPSLGVRLEGSGSRLAGERFGQIWRRCHEVTPGVLRLVEGTRRWFGPYEPASVHRRAAVDTLRALG